MTADYARGQPASAWPLAGQPCKVDCDLHTIARAHNNTFFVRLIGTLGPRVAAVEYLIMCTPIMHSTPSKLMPKWHFFGGYGGAAGLVPTFRGLLHISPPGAYKD